MKIKVNEKLRQSLFFIFLLIATICYRLPAQAANPSEQPVVYTINVNYTVNSATLHHIERVLELAEANHAEAVVFLINTPGGTVNSTLEIIQQMSLSTVPVITYVYPQAAIAASAGTFILLNGHVAAMAPQTTCGAAMPVIMSVLGNQAEAADAKTRNFLAGHMRSIAQERDRPIDIAEQFVTSNLSLNNVEALERRVVDFNASSLEDLLQMIDGFSVAITEDSRIINTADAQVINIPRSSGEKVEGALADPSTALILLMVGIFVLAFGLYSPGFFFPEIIGAIAIVLGLYGMGHFQGNTAGAVLIILGTVLLIAELFTPAFGIMGIGGLISIILGILLFPHEPLLPQDWHAAFRSIALGTGIGGAVLISLIAVGLARIKGKAPVHDEAELSNSIALVIDDLDPIGYVRFRGEIWQAEVKDGNIVHKGEKVTVISRDGLLLTVTEIKKPELKQMILRRLK